VVETGRRKKKRISEIARKKTDFLKIGDHVALRISMTIPTVQSDLVYDV